jgi:hypothetical protein
MKANPLSRLWNLFIRILSELFVRFKLTSFLYFYKNRQELLRKKTLESVALKDLYRVYDFHFLWVSPQWLRRHRKYFTRQKRGFGERAFHAAWYEVITHFEPTTALEIGVYRGQVISLWQLIAEKHDIKMNIYGLSPMEDVGDSVSSYMSLNYEEDIKLNFEKFCDTPPKLIKALSTDQSAIEFVKSKTWDLIYLDGGHDLDVVLHDYKLAVDNLRIGGILCMDDSSLFLDFQIDGIFRGHPGPSKVVELYARTELRHIMTVGHNNFFVKL